MRALWMLLWLLLASALPAQDRRATVTLEDGRTVVGMVVEMDIDQLTLDVDGQRQTFSVEQLRRCKIERLAAPKPPPRDDAEVSYEPVDPGANAVAVPAPLRGSLFGRRLQALDRRYPWLSPAEPLQWISLGIALFVFASFMLHFATRLAGTDVTGFGRSVGLAVLLLLTAMAQVALVPMTGPGLFGMLLFNTVAWVAMLRFTFELSVPAASIAFVLVLVFIGVGFGILEAVDAMLLSMGNTPT